MLTDDRDDWVSRIVQALTTGTALDLLGERQPDAFACGPWPRERSIPASAIRAALVNPPKGVDPHGLVIRGAWIDGSLNLGQADVPIPVSFESCVMEEGFEAPDCHLKGLSLLSSRIGAVDLTDSRIDGSLNMNGTIAGSVTASRATVGGHLVLDGATLSNLGGDALSLDLADVKGGLFGHDGFTATGEVRAVGTKVGGPLVLTGATLSNPGGDALNLDSADIKGDLSADAGFTANGKVRATGATIGRRLRLNGATLSNPTGDALSLDGADVKGGLVAGDGFTATGQVRALGVTIGGQLDLTAATLSNPGGDALSLDGADVKGGLLAGDGFTATGGLRALGATIGGQLDLNGATLSNPGGDALILQGADVRLLRLDGMKAFDGGLFLTACQIGDLVVDGQPRHLPRLASAAGFRVRDIHGHLRSDPKAAIAWLDTCERFTASPWEEIARVYDRNGQPADARRIRYAAANRTTRHAPGYSKPIRWFYKLTVGYGYYPLLAAVWLLITLILATALTAANPAAFLPTAANPRATSVTAGVTCPTPTQLLTAATDGRCRAPGYPEFKPFTYAVAAVSPASAVTQPAWAPLAPDGAWLEITLTALKLFGFVLTALLLAGVTGLLKRG